MVSSEENRRVTSEDYLAGLNELPLLQKQLKDLRLLDKLGNRNFHEEMKKKGNSYSDYRRDL